MVPELLDHGQYTPLLFGDLSRVLPVHAITFAADWKVGHYRETLLVRRIEQRLFRPRPHRVPAAASKHVETIPAYSPFDVERFAVSQSPPTIGSLLDSPRRQFPAVSSIRSRTAKARQ
jgi:hypothetical protein